MTIQLHTFIEDTKPSLSLVALDADNQTLSGAILDMLGYAGVVFFAVALQGENKTYGLKAQSGAAANLSDAADLLGTNVAFATTTIADGFGFLEIIRPLERYVRPQLVVPNVTTPNTVAVIALKYGKNMLPETNTDGEAHADTAEGTA
jgi:hypothetical protein